MTGEGEAEKWEGERKERQALHSDTEPNPPPCPHSPETTPIPSGGLG